MILIVNMVELLRCLHKCHVSAGGGCWRLGWGHADSSVRHNNILSSVAFNTSTILQSQHIHHILNTSTILQSQHTHHSPVSTHPQFSSLNTQFSCLQHILHSPVSKHIVQSCVQSTHSAFKAHNILYDIFMLTIYVSKSKISLSFI